MKRFRAVLFELVVLALVGSITLGARKDQTPREELLFFDSAGDMVTASTAVFQGFVSNSDTSLDANTVLFSREFGGPDTFWVNADTMVNGDTLRDNYFAIWRTDGADTLYRQSVFINGRLASEGVNDSTSIREAVIDTWHLEDLGIQAEDIDSLEIQNYHINTDAITSTKIADGAIVSADIANQTITAEDRDSTEVGAFGEVRIGGHGQIQTTGDDNLFVPGDVQFGDDVSDSASIKGQFEAFNMKNDYEGSILDVARQVSLAPNVAVLGDSFSVGSGTEMVRLETNENPDSVTAYVFPPNAGTQGDHLARAARDATHEADGLEWVTPVPSRISYSLYMGRSAILIPFTNAAVADVGLMNTEGPASEWYLGQPSVGDSAWTETGFTLPDSVGVLESEGYTKILITLAIATDTQSGMLPYRVALRGFKTGEDGTTDPSESTFDGSAVDSVYCQFSTTKRFAKVQKEILLSDLDNADFYIEVLFFRLRNQHSGYLYGRNPFSVVVE